MNYKVNKKRLHETIGKLCPCLIPNRENSIQDNICPCKEFRENKICRCKLFNTEGE